jgi:hypothetical protein
MTDKSDYNLRSLSTNVKRLSTGTPINFMQENSNETQLNELIQKRITTFNYLKKVYEGKTFYLNTTLISFELLNNFIDESLLLRR